MQKIDRPIFVTNDGKEFSDEEKAKAHEANVQFGQAVEEYVRAAYPKLKQAGITRKTKELSRFALHMANMNQNRQAA